MLQYISGEFHSYACGQEIPCSCETEIPQPFLSRPVIGQCPDQQVESSPEPHTIHLKDALYYYYLFPSH